MIAIAVVVEINKQQKMNLDVVTQHLIMTAVDHRYHKKVIISHLSIMIMIALMSLYSKTIIIMNQT